MFSSVLSIDVRFRYDQDLEPSDMDPGDEYPSSEWLSDRSMWRAE